MSNHSMFSDILSTFQPISLKELDAVSLQRRKDRKYIFHIDKLPVLLSQLSTSFKVLEINGQRIHQYQTSYYDTSDFSMYHDHHNERLNRYKVRVRHYEITESTFLEIKFKNNKRTTIKKRTPVQSENMSITDETSKFIVKNSPYDLSQLQPSLQNRFFRMTFADNEMTQRLTIDTHLFFSNQYGQQELDGLVVTELKQASMCNSPVHQILKELGIYPQRISKYCIGQALLNQSVKRNRFKFHLNKIGKICRCQLIK